MPLVQPAAAVSGPRSKYYSEVDLISGELAFLGPRGLDVLKICSACRSEILITSGGVVR